MNELTHPRAPKILPWLAHKAGVDDRRALALWHTALRQAARTHAPDTSAYWQSAVDRLEELLANESRREDIASFGWRPWARDLACSLAVRLEILDEFALGPLRATRIWARHLDHHA